MKRLVTALVISIVVFIGFNAFVGYSDYLKDLRIADSEGEELLRNVEKARSTAIKNEDGTYTMTVPDGGLILYHNTFNENMTSEQIADLSKPLRNQSLIEKCTPYYLGVSEEGFPLWHFTHNTLVVAQGKEMQFVISIILFLLVLTIIELIVENLGCRKQIINSNR
jgi:hypothetical protein